MDKIKQFVIWLDGFMQACGPKINEEQTLVVKNKLNDLFEHEADTIEEKPTLEELGEQHGFTVTSHPSSLFGKDKDGHLYRC